MKRFCALPLAAAVLSAACACGQADAAEMLNQFGSGFGYGGGMGMGYGVGAPGYAGGMLSAYPGYGGWGGSGYGGWGGGFGGRHHGWHHGGFGGYGGCGGGLNSNWDGYCNQCDGGSCGHVKVRRRCRPLGCGAGPYVDPNCCGAPADCCAPAPCGHHRCRLFHRHRRFAACCVDACCDDCGMGGSAGYGTGDDISIPSSSNEELNMPTPAVDEKPMPMPPDTSGT